MRQRKITILSSNSIDSSTIITRKTFFTIFNEIYSHLYKHLNSWHCKVNATHGNIEEAVDEFNRTGSATMHTFTRQYTSLHAHSNRPMQLQIAQKGSYKN